MDKQNYSVIELILMIYNRTMMLSQFFFILTEAYKHHSIFLSRKIIYV